MRLEQLRPSPPPTGLDAVLVSVFPNEEDAQDAGRRLPDSYEYRVSRVTIGRRGRKPYSAVICWPKDNLAADSDQLRKVLVAWKERNERYLETTTELRTVEDMETLLCMVDGREAMQRCTEQAA